MALRRILKDYQQGLFETSVGETTTALQAYPNHFYTTDNGGFNYSNSTTPLFDGVTTFGVDGEGNSTIQSTQFRQKNFRFGEFPAFDRPGLGFSPEPFIKKGLDLGGEGSFLNTITEGFIRGGAVLHAERNLTDVARITQWGLTAKGLAWNAKQLGLQKSNPKISEPGVGISVANQRTWNLGVNTLASIAASGTGLYIKRHGLFPTGNEGYRDASKLFEDSNNNRLWSLFEDHIFPSTQEAPEGETGSWWSRAWETVSGFVDSLLGTDGQALYSYGGGPHSVYGIGTTTIRKYAPYISEATERPHGPSGIAPTKPKGKAKSRDSQNPALGLKRGAIRGKKEVKSIKSGYIPVKDKTGNSVYAVTKENLLLNFDGGESTNYPPLFQKYKDSQTIERGEEEPIDILTEETIFDIPNILRVGDEEKVFGFNAPNLFNLRGIPLDTEGKSIFAITKDSLKYQIDNDALSQLYNMSGPSSTGITGFEPIFSKYKRLMDGGGFLSFNLTGKVNLEEEDLTIVGDSYWPWQATTGFFVSDKVIQRNPDNLIIASKAAGTGYYNPRFGGGLHQLLFDQGGNNSGYSISVFDHENLDDSFVEMRNSGINIKTAIGNPNGGNDVEKYNPEDAQNLMDSGVEDTKGRVLRFFDNGTAGGTPTVAKTIPLLINDFRMIRRGIETENAATEDNPVPTPNINPTGISTATNYKAKTYGGTRTFNRESRVNTGHPGKNIAGKEGKNIYGVTTSDYDLFDLDTVDQINALDVFKGDPKEEEWMRDLVRLRIEALDGDDPSKSTTMLFRAFLDSFSDKYTGGWNSFKYNGRAEEFFTYKSFKRKLSFGFKIAAQSRHEMMPLYRKINYLASQTAPDYRGTRMRGSICRLTIGSMIQRTPGFFTSISLKWNKQYPWEISVNHLEKGPDKDGAMVMPHILDVSCQFQPIHSFTPQKSVHKSPFILPSGTKRQQKWSLWDAAENSTKAQVNQNIRRWADNYEPPEETETPTTKTKKIKNNNQSGGNIPVGGTTLPTGTSDGRFINQAIIPNIGYSPGETIPSTQEQFQQMLLNQQKRNIG
jgi:hypothetical protein